MWILPKRMLLTSRLSFLKGNFPQVTKSSPTWILLLDQPPFSLSTPKSEQQHNLTTFPSCPEQCLHLFQRKGNLDSRRLIICPQPDTKPGLSLPQHMLSPLFQAVPGKKSGCVSTQEITWVEEAGDTTRTLLDGALCADVQPASLILSTLNSCSSVVLGQI